MASFNILSKKAVEGELHFVSFGGNQFKLLSLILPHLFEGKSCDTCVVRQVKGVVISIDLRWIEVNLLLVAARARVCT